MTEYGACSTENLEPSKEKRHRYAVQVLLLFGASISYLTIGMTLTWPNVLASQLPNDNSTLFGKQLHFQDWQMDMLNSLISIGSAIGLLFAGWTVRRFGRKKSLLIAVLPGMTGWIIIAMAYNTSMLLVGRFCDGITSGMVTLTVMAYATEIPDTRIRGTISTIPCLMFLSGASICVGLGIVLAWYYLALGIVCLLLIYIFFIVPLMPESPTFLIISNQEKKANEVLKRLRGSYIKLENETKLIKEMNDDIAQHKNWSFLLQRDVQKRILVLTALFLVQGFSGTAVLRANAIRILQDSGVILYKDIFASLMLLLPIAGALVLSSLVDRLGRKICLAISLMLMMVCYAVLGTNVFLQTHTTVFLVPLELNDTALPPAYHTQQSIDSSGWVSLTGLIACIFAMNIGIESLPWQLSSEYFPTTIRSQAMSVSITIGSIIASIPLQLYSIMNSTFTTAGLFWTYGVVAGIGVAFSLLCVPETARKMVG